MTVEARKYTLALGLAAAALIMLMLLSVTKGTVPLTLRQVLAALGLVQETVSPIVRQIVSDVRLPRTLLAVLTGAGLAMVGALLQTATRNDLADPFLFGLSSGASAGAVLVITRFGDSLGPLTLPVAAFAGGICSAAAVMLLFHLRERRGAEQLIICGLAVSFLFGALTSYFIFAGDQRAASTVMFWTLGGLGLAQWHNLPLAALSLMLCGGFTLWRWRSLDGLLAGEATAHSLGIDLNRMRTEIFLCCALATSLLVSLTGVIGFVGLMVPHVCRRFAGVRHLLLLPLCAVAGAASLCGGDILSRMLLAPQELPVGIITAGIGGLFIILLLTRPSS